MKNVSVLARKVKKSLETRKLIFGLSLSSIFVKNTFGVTYIFWR